VRAVAGGALRQHDGSVAWPILSRARIFDGSQDPSVVEPKMLEILVAILTRFPDYFNTVVKAVQHGGMLDTLFATEWLAVREQLQPAVWILYMAMLVEQKVLIFCPGFLVQIVALPTRYIL
jgi:hypothetical protein